MQKILTGTLSKKIDLYCIQTLKIPSLILMERAALGVRDVILSNFTGNESILVVCGTGNNGADGLAAARLLKELEIKADVICVGNIEKASEEFIIQHNVLSNIGIKVENTYNLDEFKNYDIIIDAIFGIGLSRNVEGKYGEIIDSINDSGAKVIAVDIPSGLCADTGKCMEHAIIADMTVTFGKLKSGLILCDGKKYSGETIVKEVGFDKSAYKWAEDENFSDVFNTFANEDLKLIPKRNVVSNKGTYGRINIIAGSEEMSGAAYLSAAAAYRCGAGIVEINTHEKNLQIIKVRLPEAIVSDYEKGIILNENSIAVIGPGLSVNRKSEDLLKTALKSGCRLVIDADGLNTMSKKNELMKLLHKNVIITPHIKEMSRLTEKTCDEIRENIVDTAREFSIKYGCTTVIKDATTVIADEKGKIYINLSGNSGMSTGGSGDVLTGIIAGMFSQNLSVYEAACMGVYLHGLSGDDAAKRKSAYGMIASDIIDSIPEILKSR